MRYMRAVGDFIRRSTQVSTWTRHTPQGREVIITDDFCWAEVWTPEAEASERAGQSERTDPGSGSAISTV